MPDMPDDKIVTLGEGNVRIVPAGRRLREWIGGELDLWIVQRGANPTDAFKDDGQTVAVSVMNVMGIRVAICASTGDTIASLAAYCARADIKCIGIIPRGRVTPEQILQARLYGAEVIQVPGTFDDAMKIVEYLVERGAFPGNSLNPCRIEGHQATVFNLARFFDWCLPFIIAAPVGNGSNVSSIGKALRLMRDMGFDVPTRIIGCQSEAADPLYRSFVASGVARTIHANPDEAALRWVNGHVATAVGQTLASAACIGQPVSYRKVIREIVASNGWMAVPASEKDLTEATFVSAGDGMLLCPQTATVFACLRNEVRAGAIKNQSRVAVVSTANGGKFIQAIGERFGQVKGIHTLDTCDPAAVETFIESLGA